MSAVRQLHDEIVAEVATALFIVSAPSTTDYQTAGRFREQGIEKYHSDPAFRMHVQSLSARIMTRIHDVLPQLTREL
jgi:hypothetical protein